MPPVVVVGAGPTGLLAALLLARRGREVVLVERYTEPYRLPRAVHLDDEVHRILQSVGLAEAFSAVSHPALGMRLVSARQEVLAEFPRRRAGEHGWPEANLFDQPDLEGLLRGALAAEPGVRWLAGHELVALEQQDAARPVRATVRDVSSGATGTLDAAAVLGCDGAGSTVRELVGARMRDLRLTERWLVVDLRSPEPLAVWDGVVQVCDPARAVTVVPVGRDRYRVELRLADGERAEDLARPERLLPLLRPWCAPVAPARLEVLRAAGYTFRARLADRWREGRVMLLGDAAHLTPPFVGQGLGAGMRDAANLAWKLDRVLDGAPDALLATYQAERSPHTRHVIGVAVLVGWAMTGGSDRAALVRRRALRALVRMPGFTTSPVATRMPPLRRGPLVRGGARTHRRLAGRLVPQPWVSGDGARCRLDDVLGDGFVVLSAGGPSAGLAAVARQLGAPVLQVRAPGQPGAVGAGREVVDDDDVLLPWLARGHARGVVVRPDRVVLDVDPSRGPDDDGAALLARAAGGWLALLGRPVSRTGAEPAPAAAAARARGPRPG